MDPDFKSNCNGGLKMNAVGIDVSKGKSMVCVMRPFGEVVLKPFASQLKDLKTWVARPSLF